jgi:hypothetical protein
VPEPGTLMVPLDDVLDYIAQRLAGHAVATIDDLAVPWPVKYHGATISWLDDGRLLVSPPPGSNVLSDIDASRAGQCAVTGDGMVIDNPLADPPNTVRIRVDDLAVVLRRIESGYEPDAVARLRAALDQATP